MLTTCSSSGKRTQQQMSPLLLYPWQEREFTPQRDFNEGPHGTRRKHSVQEPMTATSGRRDILPGTEDEAPGGNVVTEQEEQGRNAPSFSPSCLLDLQPGLPLAKSNQKLSDKSRQRMGRAPKRSACLYAGIKFQEWSMRTGWASAFKECLYF